MFSVIIVISLEILAAVLLFKKIKLYRNSKQQFELETKKTLAIQEVHDKLVL